MLFGATLALWAACVFLLGPYPATDAEPFLAAGHLVEDGQADAVYIDHDITPAFRAVCEREARVGRDECLSFPYVAPPMALPLSVAYAQLSWHDAALVIRALSAASLITAMVLLWRRLRDASPRAEMALAAATVFATPLVVVTLAIGNNASFIVLLAALPISATLAKRWEVAIGVGVGVCAALKVFPLVFVAAAVMGRRYRLAAAALVTLGALAVAAAMLTPPLGLYHEFLRASGEFAEAVRGNGSNGSLDAAVEALRLPHVVALVLRLGVLVAAVPLCRRLSPDLLWSVVPVLALALLPQVWSAYLLLGVVAVACASARSGRYWLLPVAAAATIFPAIAQRASLQAPLVHSAALIVVVVATVVALPAPANGGAGSDRRQDAEAEEGVGVGISA